MKLKLLFFFLFLRMACADEPYLYVEMTQYVTNNAQPVYVLVPVDSPLDASNQMAEIAAQFFGDDAWDAFLHVHDHYHKPFIECPMLFLAQHRSNKDGCKNWLVLEEDIDDPVRCIAEKWILRITDDADAKKKEKAVKDFRPGKKWKPLETHLEAVP